MKPFISKKVFLIIQSENPQPRIFASVISVSSRLHFSNTAFSRIDFWKLTFDKLHITNTVPIRSAFAKLHALRSKFFLSLLLPPFSFWKIQFSATAILKSQSIKETLEKSRKLNLLPGNLHWENPTDSKMLSEKSQFLKTQLLKFVNLKVSLINLHESKVVPLKSCPLTSGSLNSFLLCNIIVFSRYLWAILFLLSF